MPLCLADILAACGFSPQSGYVRAELRDGAPGRRGALAPGTRVRPWSGPWSAPLYGSYKGPSQAWPDRYVATLFLPMQLFSSTRFPYGRVLMGNCPTPRSTTRPLIGPSFSVRLSFPSVLADQCLFKRHNSLYDKVTCLQGRDMLVSWFYLPLSPT